MPRAGFQIANLTFQIGVEIAALRGMRKYWGIYILGLSRGLFCLIVVVNLFPDGGKTGNVRFTG